MSNGKYLHDKIQTRSMKLMVKLQKQKPHKKNKKIEGKSINVLFLPFISVINVLKSLLVFKLLLWFLAFFITRSHKSTN